MAPGSQIRFWLHRGLAAALTLAAAVLISFLLGQMAPGDAFTQLELDPNIPPATVAHLRALYLPQRSLHGRLQAWCTGLIHGDLGYSLQFHRPVLRILRERLPASLELVTIALLATWLAGFLLALAPAWLGETGHHRLERALGGLLNTIAAALAALPNGLIAVLALLVAPAAWLNGMVDTGGARGLPWLAAGVIAAAQLPGFYFTFTNTLSEVRAGGFLQQCRAAGVAPLRRLWRHALPNTTDVVVPVATLQVTQALIELVVVETVLAWPGIGALALSAAATRDMPLLAALVLLTALLVVGCNLASDLLRVRLNPRLRDEAALPAIALEAVAR